MRFTQLIHQPQGLGQLRQMAAEDRLPHANLLLSPPGGGGLASALAVATLLLCENRQGETGDTACGSCRACRKTEKYVHPDLHFAFPTIGSKTNSDPFLPQWREALLEAPYLEANDWLQRIGAENAPTSSVSSTSRYSKAAIRLCSSGCPNTWATRATAY